jgi:hypothetical protein
VPWSLLVHPVIANPQIIIKKGKIMRCIFNRALFLMAFNMLALVNVGFNAGHVAEAAQDNDPPSGYMTSRDLPAGFAALVPNGYKASSSQLTKNMNMAGVSFAAEKHFEGRHSVSNSQYYLNININQVPEALIQFREPIYRSQLQKDVENKRQNFANDQSSPTIQYDPLQVTEYAWGYGITQRMAHHFIGAGTAPDEIDYRCQYFGLITDNDNNTIKKFEMTVSGVESSTVADQWAKQVAEKVGRTTPSNIGD